MEVNAEVEDDLDEALARARVDDCYQCGKCSAGCPVAERMDLLPNQLLRLLQIGHRDKAIRSKAIWECVSCLTCTARCPKSVDPTAVIDALRQAAIAADVAAPAARRTVLFHKAFLRSVRRTGRANEMELVGWFKTASFVRDLDVPFLVKEAALGPAMLARGKLRLSAQRVRDRDVVRRIFQRCEAQQEP